MGLEQRIPEDVKAVLLALEDGGQEAWCVGGCVRDLLRGAAPEDWDVTTSARPERTMALFGKRAVPTGLRHGTVSVVTGRRRVEVTTYRRDGEYQDHRHPDAVSFTRSLEEDLARRDFTVNAMALSAGGELRDPFGGRTDLEWRTLRCVGEPDKRFGEDALRILRGLRFSAVLDFQLDFPTAQSIHRNRELLREIAAERIRTELEKLLCGPAAERVLRAFPDVLGVFLPEIVPMVGFDQRNPHHCYDLWEHTIHSVAAAPPDAVLRMTMLLHDIGKPVCFSVDETGTGHFYGHPAVSREMAAAILRRLRLDNRRKKIILTLVENHDRVFPRTHKGIRRALQALGEEDLRRLLAVKRADSEAQAEAYRAANQAEIQRAEELLEALARENPCLSLRQLAVNGRDLTARGFSGPAVGAVLRGLLDQVVEGELDNEPEALLRAAEAWRAQKPEQ